APPVIFLMGERVYLRPVETADLPRLQRWINDPHTRRFLLNVQPLNEIAERKWLESASEARDDVRFAIVQRDGDHPIGSVGRHRIDWVNRHAYFGIMIGGAALRGKGPGTEATRLVLCHSFETLNLNRVELDVYAYTPAGIRCYEKAGFTREGVLREHHF